MKSSESRGITALATCAFLGPSLGATRRATSDLNLLIEAGPNLTPWFPGGLVSDLEELLGRHVDIVTEQALHPAMRDRVLREAIPL